MSPTGSEHHIFSMIQGTVEGSIAAFINDRKAKRLSKRTIAYYEEKLKKFAQFAQDNGIETMDQVKASVLRAFMLQMENDGHNAGGLLLYYRTVRSLCNFWELETDGEWANPVKKVKPPRVRVQPIPGVPLEDIKKIIDSIGGRNQKRDEALLRTMFDTAARLQEITDMNVGDLDLASGQINIRHGKGNKARAVFVGRKARRALRRYLTERKNLRESDPLWVTEGEERLGRWGLRQILRRRQEDAGIPGEYSAHDYRRAGALQMYRNGIDSITLSRILGHSSLEVLKRYLAQDNEDLRREHEKYAPGDIADI